MGEIINFPNNKNNEVNINTNKNLQNSKEMHSWLIDRFKNYIDFLSENTPDEDKSEWNMKFTAVLKFLGDYRLDDDINSRFE